MSVPISPIAPEDEQVREDVRARREQWLARLEQEIERQHQRRDGPKKFSAKLPGKNVPRRACAAVEGKDVSRSPRFRRLVQKRQKREDHLDRQWR